MVDCLRPGRVNDWQRGSDQRSNVNRMHRICTRYRVHRGQRAASARLRVILQTSSVPLLPLREPRNLSRQFSRFLPPIPQNRKSISIVFYDFAIMLPIKIDSCPFL